MYGSIFTLKPKPGQEQEVVRIFQEWESERKPGVTGAVAGYLYKLEIGGMMGVAVFANKEDYMANANDPKQGEWYQKLREVLEEDPQWHDGEVVVAMKD